MLSKSKTISALMILGTFSSCHGNAGPQAQAGTAAQQCGAQTEDGSADTIKNCDSKRRELRKTAMEFLGIDALQISSDKVMKQIVPNDLTQIVQDGIDYSRDGTSAAKRADDMAEISDILSNAAIAAGLDPTHTSLVPGANPARVIHIGHADYLDGEGNFSVGSTYLQTINGVKVGDIYGAILGLGISSDASKSFQNYSIGLQQITCPSSGAANIVKLSDYIETQLPCFCQGTKSAIDPQTFNTIPVGISQ